MFFRVIRETKIKQIKIKYLMILNNHKELNSY